MMSLEIVVNVEEDLTRVAILEDNVLAELYYETAVNHRIVGNIYKGKVENVLPGMQAAFVNIGLEKNAFLYVADAVPVKNGHFDEEGFELDTSKLSVADVLHVGQEVVVQITKEPVGTKGARITTHITLPGRYLVLMPTVDYIGISRRIEDESERERLHQIAEKIKPFGMGLIVRTVAEGKTEKEIVQDVDFLVKLWRKVQQKDKKTKAPELIYKDLDLINRVIRDFFSIDVDRLVVDSHSDYENILDTLDYIASHLKPRVQLYTKKPNIFDAFGIQGEIDKALKRKVWLKNGGYLVIDETEALISIDVNTGKYVGCINLADTVVKTNVEAAKEIARQIRLRNFGGIIIVDFIDMETQEHKDKVLDTLAEAAKRDRVKVNVLGLTVLGLVEMTRKKSGKSLSHTLLKTCPECDGRGTVLDEKTMAARVKRKLNSVLQQTNAEAVLVAVHPLVASVLIGTGGTALDKLEEQTQKNIFIKGKDELPIEELEIISIGSKEEVEKKALPVQQGQIIDVEVKELHASNPYNGITKLEGYVIDVEGGGKFIGERVKVEITRVNRTYAKAVLIVR